MAIMSAMSAQAKQWTSDEVKNIIRKANTYWQANNPAEVRIADDLLDVLFFLVSRDDDQIL